MANWEAIAGGPLFGEVFAPLESIANTVSNILTPLQTILSIIQSILKIIRVFLLDAASLLVAVIKALVEEITSFLNQLANAGVYILTVAPDTSSLQNFVNSSRGGFDGFVDKVYNSFSDTADPQRPIFANDQPAGGVILAASSGNIANSLNLLSLVARGFKNLFSQLYVAPKIYGSAGNSTNVIVFEKPNLPNDMFTNLRYVLERSEVSGGKEKTKDVAKNTSNDKAKDFKAIELDPQTYSPMREYQQVWVSTPTNSFLAPEQYLIVDGTDEASAQLVKFNLSKRATVNTNPVRNPFAIQANLGPDSFNLKDGHIGNALGSYTVSTAEQLNEKISPASAGDDFKSKFSANGSWIDFRINGISIPSNPTQAAKNGSDLYVKSFVDGVVKLSKSVPLGSKVEAWTYIQGKTSEIISLNDFNANHPSTFTTKDRAIGGIANNKTYYYRLLVTSATPDSKGVYPVFSASPEVRLTPRLAVPPSSGRAYCMGSKRSPFIITDQNNYLDFSVGSHRFQVRLRTSRINKFGSEQEFQDSYGMILDPKLRPFSSTASQLLSGNATDALLAAAQSSEKGLQFEYYLPDGTRQIVLPGQPIPIDAEQVILDLETQTNSSVRFSVSNGRIQIQDYSGTRSSQVVHHVANEALGFEQGVCMSVPVSEPPDWVRFAVKDFIPQIYDLAELIESVANGLISAIESGVKSLVDFIDLLSTKIKVLQDFLQRIQDLLNILKNLRIQLPNMYILRVPAVNGSVALAEAIRTAGNRPVSSPDDFAFGIAIIVGGVNTSAVLPLLHLIL